MKHTKGNWKIRMIKGTSIPSYVVCDNNMICDFTYPLTDLRSEEEKAANAKLIAAAPELLEALQDIYDAQYNSKRDLASLNSSIKNSLEVIKKATE